MKTILGVIAVSILALVFAQTASAGGRTVFQASDMHDAEDESIVLAGAGILTRHRGHVDVSLHMTGLGPNHAYTAWWIIFNRPGDCTDPCGLDDLLSGVGQGFYATGYIAGADGTANVYASLARGPIPAGADRLSTFFGLDPATERGLKNTFKAEIHLISARTHGPVKANMAAAQIGSFDGGCGDPPDGFPCEDKQAVAFPAVDVKDDDDDDD